MGEKHTESWAVRAKDWGQAFLVACAIVGGVFAFSVKAVAWAKSGPEALTKAEKLERRTRRLERQSRYVVRGLEKLTHSKYDWEREERDVAREERE